MIYVNGVAFMSVDHALFQARMWREHANTFNGKWTSTGVDADWTLRMLRMNKKQCLERARIALEAAKLFNRERSDD